MPVNSTHPDYDMLPPEWSRARDVLAGEDAVKAAGEKYLPRLEDQTQAEYDAYRMRVSVFNATSRACEGLHGLLFRRDPTVKLPDQGIGVGNALRAFAGEVDLLGGLIAVNLDHYRLNAEYKHEQMSKHTGPKRTLDFRKPAKLAKPHLASGWPTLLEWPRSAAVAQCASIREIRVTTSPPGKNSKTCRFCPVLFNSKTVIPRPRASLNPRTGCPSAQYP